MNILDYSNIKEYPVTIEFFEAGGPVASGYKYLTQIKVFSKSEKIFLNYKEVRDFASPKPRLVVSNEKEISQEVYNEILTDLHTNKIIELNRNYALSNTTNVRPNFFSLTLGESVAVRFEYLLSEKDSPAFEHFENIIQLMKNLLFSNLR